MCLGAASVRRLALMLTQQNILEALKSVKYPGYTRLKGIYPNKCLGGWAVTPVGGPRCWAGGPNFNC
jgi:hypothetical protein